QVPDCPPPVVGGAVVGGRVVGGAVVGGRVVGGAGVGAGPPMDAENDFTVRPTPPIHGSKPAWMLVRYQDVLPYWEPRPRVSVMKSRTLNDKLLTAEPDT